MRADLKFVLPFNYMRILTVRFLRLRLSMFKCINLDLSLSRKKSADRKKEKK